MSTAPFKVKAIYDYTSPHDDDLNFPNGQIITVTEAEDDDWYTGEYADTTGKKHEGIFPRNFVEKYEPEIPSRPARPARAKKDSEPSAESPSMSPVARVAPDTSAERSPAVSKREASPDRPLDSSNTPVEALAALPLTQSSDRSPDSKQEPKPVAQSQEKLGSKNLPPPIADKPSAGSFKDRIAAFNKAAASPVAPFKPGAQGSSGFVKKPFVAPPPSRSAYAPPQREAPPPKKTYSGEGDAGWNEIAEDSESSMPIQRGEDPQGEQSTPTSLKDRIALLQKQQLEQAARHTEVAQKKEKPKKPARKQSESQEPVGSSEAPAGESQLGLDPTQIARMKSVDFADDDSEPLRGESGHQRPGLAHMSTPPPPSRELMSDTNDADYSGAGDTEEADDTSTSREDDRERAKKSRVSMRETDYVSSPAAADESEEEPEEDESKEEENIDPEVKRRMELRERMAKMSGGMGLMGMFGPAGGKPPAAKPRTSGEREEVVSEPQSQLETSARAPPVPVPGMSNIKSLQKDPSSPKDQFSANEGVEQFRPQEPRNEVKYSESDTAEPPSTSQRSSADYAGTPPPLGRRLPPPLPQESRASAPSESAERLHLETAASPTQGRAVPPPPPRTTTMPLSPGELSDDELSLHNSPGAEDRAKLPPSRPQNQEASKTSAAPPVPPLRPSDERVPTSPLSPISPPVGEKQTSRGLPPLPPSSPPMTTSYFQQARAPPPPPPPIQPPSRKSTSESRNMASSRIGGADDSEGEVTEYDGDYDTDIASGAKHKDALKSHTRYSSLDGDPLVEENAQKGTRSPFGRGPPPLPSVSAPRQVPPMPPQTKTVDYPRKSGDLARAAPPIPPEKEFARDGEDDEYDPYRYNAPPSGISSPQSSKSFPTQTAGGPVGNDVPYDASGSLRAPPPLPVQAPPTAFPPQSPEPSQTAPRRSLDVSKQQTGRRSMEVPRRSGEQAFMATDVDLEPSSKWYSQTPDVPPPALQKRNDIFYEIESSTSTQLAGKPTISKDVYVLYMDYSKSIISALFHPSSPDDVALEQRHERPPPTPRQDQLESASTRFGSQIATSLSSKSNNISFGDGTAHGLIAALLEPFSSVMLLPVGIRAYGAVVYANLANASTQQSDEIRPGDIVTFRNAKFAGHRGGLHTKYSIEVGKPDHVAVVADWDGTKKKIRVWEQKAKDGSGGGGGGGGGGGKAAATAKVKEESYRIGDLKSGEVRVWRVMGREWIGWDGGGGTTSSSTVAW